MGMDAILVLIEVTLNDLGSCRSDNMWEEKSMLITLISLLPESDQHYYFSLLLKAVIPADARYLLPFCMSFARIVVRGNGCMNELLDMLHVEAGELLKCHVEFMWMLPMVTWSDRQFLQKVIPKLHRCLLYPKLRNLTCVLAMQWLGRVKHGMTGKEIMSKM